MPDYHNYYGSAEDPTEKHKVESGGIRRYTKSSVFFASFQRWKPGILWRFTPNTRLVEFTNNSGKGWVTMTGLDGPSDKQTFYAYQNVKSLEQEIAKQGVLKEPRYPE